MTSLHVTVAAVIERQKRFLYVEELVQGLQVINQPAGHVEAGESFQVAIVREMMEETAWRFTPKAIVGVYQWHHPASAERFLRVVFTGKVADHDASRNLDDGIIRTLWMNRLELLAKGNSLRSPMVIRSVDDYLAGERFPVTMFQNMTVDELMANAQLVR
jgi:8-oxo-dGTP pyrophosphatase MutT (NUDIX family)